MLTKNRLKIISAIMLLMLLPTAGFCSLKSGSLIPNIALTDLEGKPVSLATISQKKATLISFVSTLGKTSAKITKELETLRKNFSESQLEIVVVFLDKNAEKAKKIAGSTKIKYLIDKKLKTPEEFQLLIVPTSYLVDKKSQISSMFVDYNENTLQEIEKAVKKLVKSK